MAPDDVILNDYTNPWMASAGYGRQRRVRSFGLDRRSQPVRGGGFGHGYPQRNRKRTKMANKSRKINRRK